MVKKSAVWNYFFLHGNYNYCVVGSCNRKVKSDVTASTKGLWIHLEAFHKKEFLKAKSEQKKMRRAFWKLSRILVFFFSLFASALREGGDDSSV